MIKATIIGASGYAGAELARLVYNHPDIEIIKLCSKSYVGKYLGELYPGHCLGDFVLSEINLDEIGKTSDVVFTALPHGVSASTVLALSAYDVKIIDLSGDYRYDDENTYEKWYNITHPSPELMKEAVYGLSEIYRDEIAKAKVVANPGCYTTCAILSLYPLLKAGLIQTSNIVIDAKSGVTGAGRKPSNLVHFCETDGNFMAYKVANHRHTSEIEQELSKAANEEIILSFTPHLLPIKRGILETIYAKLKDNVSSEDITKAYKDEYKDEEFIKLLGSGMTPQIKSVAGTNSFISGFVIDERLNSIVIVSVVDNLIKGAAGQAIQNMNIIFGIEENTGLNNAPWYL